MQRIESFFMHIILEFENKSSSLEYYLRPQGTQIFIKDHKPFIGYPRFLLETKN